MQNILGIIDSSGNLVVKYKCDAWGNHSACNPDGRVNNSETFIGNINPFRYKGYYYDIDTEMYYCKSRYYNPVLGRFISPDSIEYLDSNNINGMNLYTYCYNDPINNVDPSGCFAISAIIIGAIAGALISFGTAYAMDVVDNLEDGFDWTDFNTFKDNWQKYLCAGIGGAVAGAFGAFGNAGLSFLGSFAGNMIESAYTFTSAENVGYAIWTSLLSGALAGAFTAASNKITKSYFDKSLSNVSKNARKQLNRFINKGFSPTNKVAIQIINNTAKLFSIMGSISTISTTVLGLFY